MKLRVKKLSEAPRYDAPNHRDMRAMRVQGFEEGGPQAFWVGLSHFLPGGGAGPDAGGIEKVYVMLSGQMALTAGGEKQVLGPMDSVCIPANVEREIKNETNEVATMLVIMPYPPKA